MRIIFLGEDRDIVIFRNYNNKNKNEIQFSENRIHCNFRGVVLNI